MILKRVILLLCLLLADIPSVFADNSTKNFPLINLTDGNQTEPLLFDPNLTCRDFFRKLMLMHLIIFNIMIVKCKMKVKHGR